MLISDTLLSVISFAPWFVLITPADVHRNQEVMLQHEGEYHDLCDALLLLSSYHSLPSPGKRYSARYYLDQYLDSGRISKYFPDCP